jgi:hypothetical protein
MRIQTGRLVGFEQVVVAATHGQEYGFADIDGKQPAPRTLEDA